MIFDGKSVSDYLSAKNVFLGQMPKVKQAAVDKKIK